MLADLEALETDIESMGAAIVQIYKTIADYQENQYPHLPLQLDRRIYPSVVTLENWRMFGPAMLDRLATSVAEKLKAAGLPAGYLDEMPYPVWAIEELEVEMQVINTVGIQAFFDGKLKDAEMKQWDWHGYMKNNFRDHFPAKRLFDDEYQKLFSDLQ